jgi:hypothetical protein
MVLSTTTVINYFSLMHCTLKLLMQVIQASDCFRLLPTTDCHPPQQAVVLRTMHVLREHLALLALHVLHTMTFINDHMHLLTRLDSILHTIRRSLVMYSYIVKSTWKSPVRISFRSVRLWFAFVAVAELACPLRLPETLHHP